MNSRSMRSVRLAALVMVATLILAACGGATAPSQLTLSVSVNGAGTVTSSPTGIDTSATDEADFEDGTIVTLTAAADAGSSFAGWGGACASAVGTTCDVTMDAAKSVSATFDLVLGSLDLSITGLPGGAPASVQITGPSSYDETFTTDATVGLPPGSYTIAPAPVSDASDVYRARPQVVNVVASATATVTVAYEQPSVLLYYDSISSADDNVTPALDANGFAVTFTTTAATFDTEVAGGGYDLVIAIAQSNGIAIDLPTLATFVDDGGRAIGADWSQTAGFADVFDASFSGATNLTTADLDAPALAEGITDPIALTSSAWFTYSTGLTAGVGGSSACTFENDDSCLVSGNEGRTAMLGFLMDTIPGADDQTFWENLTLYVLDY